MAVVEFLTVQEFAERAGVSTQAVYARFNSLDKSLTKTDKRKKYISTAALELFSKQQNKQAEPSDREKSLQLELDNLKKTVSSLENQLEFSNSQIAVKDKQIESYISTIDRLTDSNQSLTETNQYLLSQNNKDSSPAGSDTVSKEKSDVQQPSEPAAAEQEAAAPAAEPQKRGFWSRLFGL